MAIESVSKRGDSADLSECDPSVSTCASGAPPNASTGASSSSSSSSAPPAPDAGTQALCDKFTPPPSWQKLTVAAPPPPKFEGCGETKACADLDGRPVRAGQNVSEPNVSFSVTARRFAPFETFGGKFEGDAKSRGIPAAKEGTGGFTTDPNATARTMMRVEVNQSEIARPFGHADMTRNPILGEARARIGTYDKSVATSSSDGVINSKFSGANPLVGVAPDIDSDAQVAYRMSPGKLHLEGSMWGDVFPNGELTISDSKGARLMLGQFQTKYEELQGPFLHLFGGSARTPDLQLLEFEADIPLDPDGNFAGSPAVRSK